MPDKSRFSNTAKVSVRIPAHLYENIRLWVIERRANGESPPGRNRSFCESDWINEAIAAWDQVQGIPPPDPSIAIAAEKAERQRIQKLKAAINEGLVAREDYLPPEALTAPDDDLLSLMESVDAEDMERAEQERIRNEAELAKQRIKAEEELVKRREKKKRVYASEEEELMALLNDE